MKWTLFSCLITKAFKFAEEFTQKRPIIKKNLANIAILKLCGMSNSVIK